jgi:UDP-N-acetylmuramoyl-L-alanyl-D-glutamate--2,6-diaminopimelate ligase
MDYSERVLNESKKCKRIITFGLNKEADIYGYNIKTNGNGISFNVQSDSFSKKFKLSMSGFFNVYNALAAISICYALNIPIDNIYNGLKKAKVSGRMEIFIEPTKNLHIVVDYAHNKMSFESLFESTKKDFPESEISIVFGCPGKKAQARRKELGEIAGKYANKAFITEEDAGEEPVLKICEEIVKHMEGNVCECSIIEDREEAIREAIKDAAPEGVILITGKGRETRQKRGLIYVKTRSDVKIVKNVIEGK